MPQPMDNIGQNQKCIARAVYDNIAEAADELEFRKGDILTVLEQNTSNIEGWWLCALKGRQGICPANRLRLLPGVYEDTGQKELSSDFSYFPKYCKRRNWQEHTQVVTPKKYNDELNYDMPPRCSPVPVSGMSPRDDYDVPPRAVPLNNEGFRNCPRCSPASSSCVSPISRDGDTYDVPRPHNHLNQLTPSSSASSLTADSLSSSNRSSMVNMPDYDIPKPINSCRGPQLLLHPPQTYDTPTAHHTLKELPLELNSALENLERLETDTTSAITKLLGFVGPHWRTKEKLSTNILEIKLAVTRLQTSLHDLTEFGEGTLGNAAKASDKNLASKLAPLVISLRKSYHIVQDASEKLKEHNWSIEVLSRPDEEDRCHSPDALEHLVACSKALTEDIRQIAAFIQGNGLLLFKKEIYHEWTDEYDYVRLDSKESFQQKHAEIRNALPKELQEGYEDLVKKSDDVSMDNDHKTIGLDASDKQLLTFFGAQFVTHHRNLSQAIDAFLLAVEHNQPPKVFLAHGKFVVLSAHKLVNIGDTVHRNVSCKEIRERALSCSNSLSDFLAASVNKTKQAALQFPNVIAVQAMVDGVLAISQAANNLKICLLQATTNFL